MRALLSLLLAFAAPVHAVTERTGTTSGGSAYRLVVPDGWRTGDGLVLVQHGFRFGRVDDPGTGPSAARMLADGYAIAAPGYRQSGWTVAAAIADNAELLSRFRSEFGEPGPTLAHGGSMGGLIALKLAEHASTAADIDGVVALCPAADAATVWDEAFDLRVVYDALCHDVPGGALPAGGAPFAWASNLDVLGSAPRDPLAFPSTVRALAPVQACLGLHAPEAQRTASQRERIAGLMALAGTQDEDALAARLAYAFWGLADLVRAPDKLAGRSFLYNLVEDGGHSRDIDYTETDALRTAMRDLLTPDTRRHLARVGRDDFARLAFQRDNGLEGSARQPIVSVHTSADGVVAPEMQRYLWARYEGRAGIAIVREAQASHCGFSQGEYDAAWTLARQRVEAGSATPVTAGELQSACVAEGTGACRFDPGLSATMQQPEAWFAGRRLRQPQRELSLEGNGDRIHTLGGLWWDTARPAQGLLLEELDDLVGEWRSGEQRVTLGWYTWAPAGSAEPGPRWFFGVGRAWGLGVTVDLLEVRGGRFGVLLDPAQVTHVPWGRVDIAFDRRVPEARYRGPARYGEGTLALTQLARAGFGLGSAIDVSPPISGDHAAAGTYYDPAHPAGGWVLLQYTGDNAYAGDTIATDSMLVWFTWDNSGRPVWMYGLDETSADGLHFDMIRANGGGRFEPGYALSQVSLMPWGEVDLDLGPCPPRDVSRVRWRAETHGYGDGDRAVRRLTQPTLRFAGCP